MQDSHFDYPLELLTLDSGLSTLLGSLMEPNPTLGVIWSVLEEVDPSRAKLMEPSGTGNGSVIVNGIRVPVVRVGWKQVWPFFERLFQEANHRFFGGLLPDCRIEWNKRFRNLGGRIDCCRRRLELSATHYEACGAAALGVVLVHEQIHLGLYEEGLPYGHTPRFKIRSHRLGLPDVHHEMPLPERLKKPIRVHLFECRRCGKVIRSRVRFRKPRACAECCDRHAGGEFDPRFALSYIRMELDNST